MSNPNRLVIGEAAGESQTLWVIDLAEKINKQMPLIGPFVE